MNTLLGGAEQCCGGQRCDAASRFGATPLPVLLGPPGRDAEGFDVVRRAT